MVIATKPLEKWASPPSSSSSSLLYRPISPPSTSEGIVASVCKEQRDESQAFFSRSDVDKTFSMLDHDELCFVVDELTLRVVKYIEELQLFIDDGTADSASRLLLDVCQKSLRAHVVTTLRHASQMVEGAKQQRRGIECDDAIYRTMGLMRPTVALVRARLFMNMVELALVDKNDIISDELKAMLEDIHKMDRMGKLRQNGGHRLGLTISPWYTTSLAFELPCGPSTITSSPLACSDPFTVELVPIFEVKADDLRSRYNESNRSGHGFRICHVKTERCTYGYSSGLGTVGEVTIRVKIAPSKDRDQDEDVPVSKDRTWGCNYSEKSDVEAICVKEARAVQVNAYPSVPRTSVDLFTSNTYGEDAVSLTMSMKTYQTRDQCEVPKLHVQLVVAALES